MGPMGPGAPHAPHQPDPSRPPCGFCKGQEFGSPGDFWLDLPGFVYWASLRVLPTFYPPKLGISTDQQIETWDLKPWIEQELFDPKGVQPVWISHETVERLPALKNGIAFLSYGKAAKQRSSTPLLVFRPCQCMARTWAILDYVTIEHVVPCRPVISDFAQFLPLFFFHPQVTAIHSILSTLRNFGRLRRWGEPSMSWVPKFGAARLWTLPGRMAWCLAPKKWAGVVGVIIPVMIPSGNLT